MSAVETEKTFPDGWGPDTPVEDTYLRQYVDVLARSADAHVASQGGRTEWRTHVALADLGGAAGFANGGTLLKPPADPYAIAQELQEFADEAVTEAGGSFFLWSAWPLPEPRGPWKADGHPPVMLRLPGARPPGPASALEVREVKSVEEMAAFDSLIARSYPLERPGWQAGRLFGPGALASGWRFWLGWFEGEPVATSASYRSRQATEINYVSVAAEARGRGFGAEIAWAPVQAEAEWPAMLLASDRGRSTYERMGFLPLSRYSMWLYERPTTK